MRYWALLVTPFLLAGCVGQAPAPVANACVWEKVIHPDPGFETRLTHNEKVQLVEHNRLVRQFCPELQS